MITLKTVTLSFDLGQLTAVRQALDSQKITVDRTIDAIAQQVAAQFAEAEQVQAKASRAARRAAKQTNSEHPAPATPQ